MTKGRLARVLTVVGTLLFVVHFTGFWTLASTFASGLVWWLNILCLLGPPSALVAWIVSLRQHQSRLAWLNGAMVLVYAAFYIWLIPQLTLES